MSTLGSLMLALSDPGIKPYNEQELTANRIQFGNTQNQTQLIELAELKRQQEAQQLARQYYQANPGAVLGGGGSVLGSLGTAPAGPPGGAPLTQQTYCPGDAPTTQTVPAPMQPNANLGGMPGGPPQSTLGSLGSQPQQHPLMDLVRTNPDAAFAVMQRAQQQEDVRMKRDEARLSTGVKVLEYVGRQAQGVTDQAGLDAMRQDLQRLQLHQYAAQLPQGYSKEAMVPFVKRAVSAKDNALLQLETWKNQIEEQKLGVQLAQAGYQGLGTDVTGVLRGLTPEHVQQFGGRTTPAAIAYATDQVRNLDVEKREKEGLAGAQATAQAGREARQTQTLSEAFKGETVNLYHTQTGRPLPSRMKVSEYEQLPQTQVTQLSDDNRKQMENLNTAMPRLQILQQHIDAVYGPGGVLERMSPADRELVRSPLAITTQVADQFAQKYPELAAARKYIDANAESLARALSGVRGAATESDVERAKAMLPNLTAALKVWPLSEAGLSLPDTRETALRTMNNLADTLNGIGTAILGNPDYRTPLKRYEDPSNVPGPGLRAGEGSFRLTPRDAPSERPAPAPVPAPPPAPTQGPAFGAPAQQRYVPGEGTPPSLPPAPATRPAPPTATSTPAQDEAYRQWVAPRQAPAPAPSAPAARQAPGRQSQAPAAAGQTRVARWRAPQFMNQSDVVEAMRQTGKSRREVEAAARAKGYTVYGSKLPLPEETSIV